MPRPARFTDEQLLDLLSGAPSISHLEDSLGYHHGAIKLRCRPVPALWLAYSKCKERGQMRPRGSSQGQAIRGCSLCGSPSHDRRFCSKRRSLCGKYCVDCAGLPWRRPRGIRVLCICGEAWAPEPTVTIGDVLEQPNFNKRELI